MLPLCALSAVLLVVFVFVLYRKDPRERIEAGAKLTPWGPEGRIRRVVYLVLFLLIGFFSSCSYTHTPPDPGTPFPAAHNGTFVCDRDTLWFNGDGKTVSWHFAQPLPELAAKGKGEYVFLFGHGKWRYDAAEKLRLIDTAHDNGSHTFLLAAPAADSLITLYVNKGAHVASAPFRKAIL